MRAEGKDNMAFLEVKGIEKSFGRTEVLKGIDFSMEKGAVLAIIGSSGSGKTTLLRCLNFLETPDKGSISVNGDVMFDCEEAPYSDSAKREKRLHFGLVFQSFTLFPQYNVLRNISLAPELRQIRGRKISNVDIQQSCADSTDNSKSQMDIVKQAIINILKNIFFVTELKRIKGMKLSKEEKKSIRTDIAENSKEQMETMKFAIKKIIKNMSHTPKLKKEKGKKLSNTEKKKIRADIDENSRRLLDTVGLAAKTYNYPCELSGGQQQRVAIARALALNPDILCFDEPTSALDPELTGEVLRVIRELKNSDRTMIVVTHEMNFARGVADKVIFMADGVIEEYGSPDEVFGDPKSPVTKAFLEKSDRKSVV